jgi:hypothetical protein
VFSVLVCRKDFTQKLTLLFFHEAIPDSTSWAEIWVSTANRGCAHGPELTSLRSALTPKGCGTEDRPKRLLKTETVPRSGNMSISCQDLLPVVQASCLWSRPRGLCYYPCKSLLVGVWFILTRPCQGTYLPVPVESVGSQNDRQLRGSSVRLPVYIPAKSCRAPLETTSCRNGSRDSVLWLQESRAFTKS